jgi:hypothetical protein
MRSGNTGGTSRCRGCASAVAVAAAVASAAATFPPRAPATATLLLSAPVAVAARAAVGAAGRLFGQHVQQRVSAVQLTEGTSRAAALASSGHCGQAQALSCYTSCLVRHTAHCAHRGPSSPCSPQAHICQGSGRRQVSTNRVRIEMGPCFVVSLSIVSHCCVSPLNEVAARWHPCNKAPWKVCGRRLMQLAVLYDVHADNHMPHLV